MLTKVQRIGLSESLNIYHNTNNSELFARNLWSVFVPSNDPNYRHFAVITADQVFEMLKIFFPLLKRPARELDFLDQALGKTRADEQFPTIAERNAIIDYYFARFNKWDKICAKVTKDQFDKFVQGFLCGFISAMKDMGIVEMWKNRVIHLHNENNKLFDGLPLRDMSPVILLSNGQVNVLTKNGDLFLTKK